MSINPDTSLPSAQPEQSYDAQAERRVVNTQGGDYAEGDIDKRRGTFVEGNLFVIEDQVYNVAGLRNPYIGLRSFTAAERDIFAGRERIVRTLVDRLSADDGDQLLFIVGASGSGKSSLARAGLIPALAEQFSASNYVVQTCIIDHPGRTPTRAVGRILDSFGASDTPPTSKVLLLLIDQFEEIFSQTDSDERDRALILLARQTSTTDRPVRIIATMRSDFLPQLVADARFEPYERHKVVVRGMSLDELRDAIQRPIQVHHPEKRIEPALLNQLATDAAADAAYLPLLQVTLEDLWRGGELRRGAYRTLGDAIQRRAEAVYAYRNYDSLQDLRPDNEQEAIRSLFLDLVRVSLDDQQRDMRWRRLRTELTLGSPQRERLVDDLATARLLRTDQDENAGGETVDLIHEALLTGWPRLREAIDNERDRLRRREHFLLALNDWLTHKCHDDYLLTGVRLAEAEALKQQNDIALHGDQAQDLLRCSLAQREVKRQQQVQQAHRVVVGLSILTLLALLAASAAGWFGVQARQREAEASNNAATAVVEQQRADTNAAAARTAETRAIQQRDIAEIRQAAAQALNNQSRAAQRSLLLATEALSRSIELDNTSDAVVEESLRQILASTGGIPLRGHTAAARVVAVSPDDRRIASGDVDGLILLQSTTEPPAVDIELHGHTSGVSGLVFRPDGRWLVSSSWDGTVRIWNLVVESPGESTIVLEQDSAIRTLALSADGQWLATGTAGGKVWLYQWGGENGFSEPLILREETNAVNIVTFSPDSTWLAVANESGTVGLWKRTTAGWEKLDISGHKGDVTALAFSPSSHYLATGGHDANILFWSLVDGKLAEEPVRLQRHTSHINALSFSPDGRSLVSSSWGTAIRVWSVEEIVKSSPEKQLKEVFLLMGHTYGVNTIAFSPDGKYLLSGSEDQTIRLWDTNDYARTPLVLYGHDSSVVSLQFSSKSQWWVSTGWKDSSPRIWQIAAPVLEPRTFYGPMGVVERIAFSPDGNSLAATRIWERSALIWNLRDQTKPPIDLPHPAGVRDVSFSPDGRWIATTCEDGYVRLWDLLHTNWSTANLTLGDGVEPTLAVAFSPDSRWVAAGGSDAKVLLWDLYADNPQNSVRSFDGEKSVVTAIAFSPDGSQFVVASGDGWIRNWSVDAAPGTPPRRLYQHSSSVQSVMFDPTGDVLASGGDDTVIRLWDVTTQSIKAELRGHEASVADIAFSRDGQWLASAGSRDNTVKLWDLSVTNPKSITLRAHTSEIRGVAFSPTTDQVASGARDGTIRLWSLRRDAVLNVACTLVDRNLTEQEWTRVFTQTTYQKTCLIE